MVAKSRGKTQQPPHSSYCTFGPRVIAAAAPIPSRNLSRDRCSVEDSELMHIRNQREKEENRVLSVKRRRKTTDWLDCGLQRGRSKRKIEQIEDAEEGGERSLGFRGEMFRERRIWKPLAYGETGNEMRKCGLIRVNFRF